MPRRWIKSTKHHVDDSELSDLIGLTPSIQARQMLKYFALAIKQFSIQTSSTYLFVASIFNVYLMFCTL